MSEQRCLLMYLSLTFVLFVLAMGVTTFTWGDGQALTPIEAERRLSVGMTLAEAACALGVRIETIERGLDRGADGNLHATVTHAGILGTWFVPQHEITVVFGKDRRLVRAYVEVYWRADEEYVELNIRRTD